MEIAKIIAHLTSAIWLFIPLRQIGTNYFYYFLINAISSALLLLNGFFYFHPAYLYLGQGLFLIISLFDFKKLPNYIFILLGILGVSILLPFIISIKIIPPLLIIEHIIIFLIILKKTIQYFAKYEKLVLFHFVLLLFVISLITRFYVIIQNIRTGIIFFYLTTALGILIGIYFLFYNEKNSFKISLSSVKN
jgi:hypothetical protein